MNPDNTNVGWYYKDFSKDFKSISVDYDAKGEKTIKPGETLIMFSNNHNTNVGYTLHRCPHHLEPGIPLFDYEDREGWIVYDPISDPTWNIYDAMPTIENINFTITPDSRLTDGSRYMVSPMAKMVMTIIKSASLLPSMIQRVKVGHAMI